MVILSIAGVAEWAALSRSTKPAALMASLTEAQENKLREEFAKWLLQLIKAQAQECIRTQKFPVEFEPLSAAWTNYKERHGLKPGFWIATGTLLKTINVWKDRPSGEWRLGWLPDRVNPISKTSVAVIAEALERGNPEQNRPARPLFTTLANRAKKSSYRLFYAFCQRHHPEHLSLLPRP